MSPSDCQVVTTHCLKRLKVWSFRSTLIPCQAFNSRLKASQSLSWKEVAQPQKDNWLPPAPCISSEGVSALQEWNWLFGSSKMHQKRLLGRKLCTKFIKNLIWHLLMVKHLTLERASEGNWLVGLCFATHNLAHLGYVSCGHFWHWCVVFGLCYHAIVLCVAYQLKQTDSQSSCFNRKPNKRQFNRPIVQQFMVRYC